MIILWVGVIYFCLFLLQRWLLVGHETLQAAIGITALWGFFLGMVLTLPQIPSPIDYYFALIITVGFVVCSILYFKLKSPEIDRLINRVQLFMERQYPVSPTKSGNLYTDKTVNEVANTFNKIVADALKLIPSLDRQDFMVNASDLIKYFRDPVSHTKRLARDLLMELSDYKGRKERGEL